MPMRNGRSIGVPYLLKFMVFLKQKKTASQTGDLFSLFVHGVSE
jgi:hypothetical protein